MIATTFAAAFLAGMLADEAVRPLARRLMRGVRRREAWPRFLEIGAETRAALQRLGLRRVA